MSNEIAPIQGLTTSRFGTDEAFSDVSSSGFLPRLQLMQAGSVPVQTGKMQAGAYALVKSKDNVEDLTREVSILVLSWRPKALRITEKEVISVYNNKSREFLQIKTDSEQPNSGCMYGPEFLVWLSTQKTFATFFCSSTTARREAGQLLPLVGRGALLRSTLIRGKKFSWQGPVITGWSQGFTNMPSDELLKLELERFNNPPDKSTEEPDENLADRPQ